MPTMVRKPVAAEAGSWAAITGASSGIGAAFARLLAGRGYNLLLAARREDRLKALGAELRGAHGIQVEAFQADLADPADLARLAQRLEQIGPEILINNAGFGLPGRFVDIPADRLRAMVQVHIAASVELCRAVLPGMIARGRGGIINVSSIASFLPAGGVAYTSTKAFLNAFSQTLAAELAGTGVTVQALCPGFTRTEFHDRPEYDGLKNSVVPGPLWMSAERVAALSFAALGRGPVVFVPGYLNRALAFFARRKLVAGLAWRVARKRMHKGRISAQDENSAQD